MKREIYELTLPWILLFIGIFFMAYWMVRADNRMDSMSDEQIAAVAEIHEIYKIMIGIQVYVGEHDIKLIYLEDWRDSILLPELGRGEITKEDIKLIRESLRNVKDGIDGEDITD